MGGHGNSSFWQELGRRNVLRVGAAYAVASFAIIEVMSNVSPALHLPDWALSFVVVLLALGFPAVLAFSWIYEITPDGLKRTDQVAESASITHRTAHRLNVVTIALVLLLAGLYGADRLLPARQTAEAGSPAAPQSAQAGISIAVLPFVNLSGDPSQEFFSDGMTEEITSALAKVKGFKVVGRTSAFEFKGQNKDLHAIGQALRASHLLEGSLRKSGNRVRITGQLIRADDGTHIWTENYDRDLTDIFATQDDIAHAIAAALQVPLGLNAGETLVAGRAIDAEHYQQYLQAKALVRGRGAREPGGPITQAIGLLEQVIAHDPNYAPAWSLLSYAHSLTPVFRQRVGDVTDDDGPPAGTLATAEAAARKAIELDARAPGGYMALAYTQTWRGKWAEAEDLFKQALALDPNDPDALHEYSVVLLPAVGRLREALSVRKTLLGLEPFVPGFNYSTAFILILDAQNQAALNLLPKEGVSGNILRARILADEGKYAAGAEAILSDRSGIMSPELLADAAKLLRTAPAKAANPAALPVFRTRLSFIYAHVGASDRILEGPERSAAYGLFLGVSGIWDPALKPLRRTERFRALVRQADLPGYWRARGWPDMCRPVGADDFVCD